MLVSVRFHRELDGELSHGEYFLSSTPVFIIHDRTWSDVYCFLWVICLYLRIWDEPFLPRINPVLEAFPKYEEYTEKSFHSETCLTKSNLDCNYTQNSIWFDKI